MMHFVDTKVRGNQVIERLYARYMPSPFLSILIDDCIVKGLDYNEGGARYNTTYIQGVGIGTITDSLAAIKLHVFENQTLTMDDLLGLLKGDFAGHERERLLFVNKSPKYGNDDDCADSTMVTVFNAYHDAVTGRKNTRGGYYAIDIDRKSVV